MKRGFAALAVVGVVAAIAVFALNQAPFSGMNLNYSGDTAFAQYLAKHGKSYATKEEYEMRKILFEARLIEISDHNSQNDQTWFKAVNFFADMLPHEAERMRGLGIEGEHRHHIEVIPDESFVSAGTPVDWRRKMNAVRHQGFKCGACWTFAATAAIEGRYAIKKGSIVSLSEQQMLDCTSSTDNCIGGWPINALNYIKNAGGQMSRSAYPYVEQKGTCKFSPTSVVAKVSGVSGVSDPKSALASGPVVAQIQMTKSLEDYGYGIFNGACGTPNHAVTIVGWGSVSASQEYWILRNSYGSTWGESGHARIQIGGNCKIKFDSYPIIA